MNTLKAMKTEFSDLQAKIAALNEEMKDKSKILMKETLKEFFTKYDGVVSNIFWTQYTPFFNDGESCEFSVHDVHVQLANDDEEDEDGEGSQIHSKDDIAKLKERIAVWERFNANPAAAAKEYRSNYMERYKRDPFAEPYWNNRDRLSPEEQMAKWTPDYASLEYLQNTLINAEKIQSEYSDLYSDYKEVQSLVSGIDEDIMKAMFGDHVKVICSKDGIEVEEYEHD